MLHKIKKNNNPFKIDTYPIILAKLQLDWLWFDVMVVHNVLVYAK